MASLNPPGNADARCASDARLAGRRVLVTGASGFIGAHLSRRLAALGCSVFGVSRASEPADAGRVLWRHGDLAEPEFASRVVDECRPELIFHLASHVSGSRQLDRVLPTVRDNLLSTVNVLTAAAARSQARLVLAGSMEEPLGLDADEAPVSPYAAAKWAAAAYARLFDALYELPVARARLFMVYGEGVRDQSKLVPYVIRSLLAGDSPALSSGSRAADWIHVDDAVSGLMAMAAAPRCPARPVDLGSGSLATVRRVAQELERLTGCPGACRFSAIPDRQAEPQPVADIHDTLRRIGWRPSVTLREGLERTVRWYRDRHAADAIPAVTGERRSRTREARVARASQPPPAGDGTIRFWFRN